MRHRAEVLLCGGRWAIGRMLSPDLGLVPAQALDIPTLGLEDDDEPIRWGFLHGHIAAVLRHNTSAYPWFDSEVGGGRGGP